MVEAKAEDKAEDHDIQQQLKKIEAQERKEEEKQSGLNQKIQPVFGEKVRLNGVVELSYEYLDVKEIDNKNSDSSADFFLATTELAISIF